MSIATLKKKTQTKYNNMSVGSKNGGFSLNGTHRSQGFVGQTMLSRHLPQTLMKGDTIRGHGGCCGKYPIKEIVQSGVTDVNDTRVVKPSVIQNMGMIHTKYRWIWRPQPFSVVKPDNTLNNNSQNDYITKLTTKTISDVDNCVYNKEAQLNKNCNGIPINQSKICGTITKSESTYVATSQSDHVLEVKGKCGINDKSNVSSSKNTPFACA